MFSLQKQKLKLSNINVRAEKHGDDTKLAADVKLTMKVSNDILSEFDPSLKSALYAEGSNSDQGELPIDEPGRLSALKFPNMSSIGWGIELKGFDFRLHYGIGGKSDIKLSECEVDKFRFTPQDGGTVEVSFRVIVHPEAAQLGRMCELIQAEIEVSLTPPEEQQQEMLEAA
jgi:hypothetical protein